MAVLMFYRGQQRIHYIWGLFCISVFLWGLGGYRIATNHNIDVADFWWRITHVGVIAIPILFTHFVYEFLNLKRRWFIILNYILGAGFLIANFTDGLFIANMRWVFNQFYYDSPPGPLYPIFTVFFFGLVLYSHFELWKAYKVSQGIIRQQIKYFFFGMAVSFAGGGLSFLPVYNIDFYPYFNLTTFLYTVIVGFAILRYRLLDIRVIIRRVFIYASLAMFSYGFFYFMVWIFENFLGGSFSKASLISGIFIAPTFLFIFYKLNDLFQSTANKYFFVSLYNYQKTISQLTEKLNYLTNLSQIIDLITTTLQSAMQLDRAGILLATEKNKQSPTDYKIAKVAGFSEANINQLTKSNLLLNYLQRNKRPLFIDELTYLARNAHSPSEQIGFEQLKNDMKKIEVSVCVPFMSGNKLNSILILGTKISGDAYTKEDFELLRSLSLQAGIAIQNSLLYQEVQDFSQHLQEKVDDQTKELKGANERLKELDKLKDDFVSIASHELRTPMTVIKSYLWMALNKKKMSADLRKYLDRSRLAVDRLINLVNNMLNVSRIESGRIALQVGDVNLVELAQEIFEEVEAKAKEIQLSLKIVEPKKVPVAFCDKEKIREVFLNFISNAMKFTPPHGTITISFAIQEPFVKTSVTDTGNGIAPEDLKKLFTKFGKIQNSYSGMAEARGTGLGLYISKSIVALHHGNVDVQSEGVSRGSTFSFTLPLVDTDIAHQVAEDAKKSENADAKTLISIHETKQPKS